MNWLICLTHIINADIRITKIKEYSCQINIITAIDSSTIFTFSNTDLSATELTPDMQFWDKKKAQSKSNLKQFEYSYGHTWRRTSSSCAGHVCCVYGQVNLQYILLTHQKTIKLTMLYISWEVHAEKGGPVSFCTLLWTAPGHDEGSERKTLKQRHPHSSKDGKVRNNVSKIYQKACTSVSQGGVEHFKRVALTLQVATQGVQTRHKYQKTSRTRQ